MRRITVKEFSRLVKQRKTMYFKHLAVNYPPNYNRSSSHPNPDPYIDMWIGEFDGVTNLISILNFRDPTVNCSYDTGVYMTDCDEHGNFDPWIDERNTIYLYKNKKEMERELLVRKL